MASNPMQRKARNSFILGVVVATLVCALVIAFIGVKIKQMSDEKKTEEANKKTVQVLNCDVPSNGIITKDMLKQKTVSSDTIPSNYIDSKVITLNEITPKDGNIKIEIKSRNKDGGNEKYAEISFLDGRDDRSYELKTDSSGKFYYESGDGDDKAKNYVDIVNVPYVAKVALKANTILTQDLICKSDAQVSDDLRDIEFTTVQMPMQLTTGDYVDLRILYPTGQDFIVLSKKEVTIPVIDDSPSATTFFTNLREEELLFATCALIDSYKISGTKVYLTRYSDPGIQEAAQMTYMPSAETLELYNKDSNIQEWVKAKLRDHLSDGETQNVRNESIDSLIYDTYNGDKTSEVRAAGSKLDAETKTVADQRAKYIKSLAKASSKKTTTTTTSTQN